MFAVVTRGGAKFEVGVLTFTGVTWLFASASTWPCLAQVSSHKGGGERGWSTHRGLHNERGDRGGIGWVIRLARVVSALVSWQGGLLTWAFPSLIVGIGRCIYTD